MIDIGESYEEESPPHNTSEEALQRIKQMAENEIYAKYPVRAAPKLKKSGVSDAEQHYLNDLRFKFQTSLGKLCSHNTKQVVLILYIYNIGICGTRETNRQELQPRRSTNISVFIRREAQDINNIKQGATSSSIRFHREDI